MQPLLQMLQNVIQTMQRLDNGTELQGIEFLIYYNDLRLKATRSQMRLRPAVIRQDRSDVMYITP